MSLPYENATSGASADTDDIFGGRRVLKGQGYAAAPGSGPAGETCGTCAHFSRGRKSYHKCRLVKRTGGPGTDILVSAPACAKWEST